MPTTTVDPFNHHMNAMQEHYKSGASHQYALPLDLVHPENVGEMALTAFAVTGDDSKTEAGYKEIITNVENSLTDIFSSTQSKIAAAVKAFEKSSDLNALIAQLEALKTSETNALSAEIEYEFDALMKFGTKHPHTQHQILTDTNQIGGFINSLLNQQSSFMNKLASDIVTWSQEVVTESIWTTIGHWFTKTARSIGNFFTKLGADIVYAFNAIAKAAEAAWDGLKHLVEEAIEKGAEAILKPIAQRELKNLPLDQIISGWTAVQESHADHIDTIRASVMNKQTTPEAQKSMLAIREAMKPHLGNSGLQAMAVVDNQQNFFSLGVEFQATASLGIGGEGAIGMLCSLPAGAQSVGYGSLGASVGVEIGAEADVAFVYKTMAPKDTGGPYVGIIISLEAGAGATTQVLFTFPGFKFSGISIGLGGGEDVSLALDGGYTWIF